MLLPPKISLFCPRHLGILLLNLSLRTLASATEPASPHWSFAPVRTAAPPSAAHSRWPRTPIDLFVLARLDAAHLQPAPPAPADAWFRRVSLALTGLPPSPEALSAFLSDRSPNARERAVDALLQSPHYGEHWAQHWLDVVRYADTHGFEVNTERPNAWPYRDYVIRAFNQDLPYHRFIREQLTGDLLGEDAATGFLVTASVLLPGQIGKDEPSIRLARQDALDEIVVNISQTFLALSVGCARCHDHKFDPITQADYFGMQSFVAGVEYEDRDLHGPDSDARRAEADRIRTRLSQILIARTRFVPRVDSGVQRVAVNGRLNIERFAPTRARRVRLTLRETNSLEPCIDELEVLTPDDVNVAAAARGASAKSSGDTVDPGRHELRHIHDGRYGNSRSWMSNQKGGGWVVIEFDREHEVDRVLWGRDREAQYDDRLATRYLIELADDSGIWHAVASSDDRTPFKSGTNASDPFTPGVLSPNDAQRAQSLVAEKNSLDSRLRTLDSGQRAFAGMFRKPDRTRLLRRGDPEQPREDIAPATPAFLGAHSLGSDASDPVRRMALADWITHPAHPLTARVLVNRVWQGHFGMGLVDTPSDFGRNGSRPSHPELLDWLAGEFIRNGQSIKQLHRLIVLSATYAQSIEPGPSPPGAADPRRVDADNRLLGRFPSRRLEAESLRDSILAVSGRLNTERHGPGFDLFDLRGGLSGFKPVESFPPSGRRRMIYSHKIRREREAVFGAFDCPDAGQSTARRRESITAIQALNLFNSRFTLDEAQALALLVQREAGDSPEARIRHAWFRVLGRQPDPAEVSDAFESVRVHGLIPLCRALFNSNEFLFNP